MARNLSLTMPRDGLTWLLVLLSVGVLAACAAFTWLWLQSSVYETEIRAELEAQRSASKQQELIVPELTLNKKGGRLGPEATVNPATVGKDDPFN